MEFTPEEIARQREIISKKSINEFSWAYFDIGMGMQEDDARYAELAVNNYPTALDRIAQQQAEIGRLTAIKECGDKLFAELRRYSIQVRDWSAVEDAMQAYKDLSGGAE